MNHEQSTHIPALSVGENPSVNLTEDTTHAAGHEIGPVEQQAILPSLLALLPEAASAPSPERALKHELHELACEIGIHSVLRGDNEARLLQLEKSYAELVEAKKELFAKNPELEATVQRLRTLGEEEGRNAVHDIEQRVTQIFIASHPNKFIRSFETVRKALSDLTPNKVQLLFHTFYERYGRVLEPELHKYFKGHRWNQIENLLDCKEVKILSDRLSNIFDQRFGKVEELKKFFRSLPEELREKVEQDFNSRHAARYKAPNLDGVIEKAVPEKVRERVLSLKAGNIEHATGIEIHTLLRENNLFTQNRKWVQICRLLESLSAESIVPLCLDYKHTFGIELWSDIRDYLPNGPLRSWALSLLVQDEEEINVCKLDAALHGAYGVWLGELAAHKTPDELQRLISSYERKSHADFWDALDFATTYPRWTLIDTVFGCEHLFLVKLFTEGKLSKAEAVAMYTFGAGTAEEDTLNTLRDQTRAEAKQTAKDFLAMYEHTLKNRIKREFSGDDYFDAMLFRRGQPEGPISQYVHLKFRFNYEEHSRLIGFLEATYVGNVGLLKRGVRLLRNGVRSLFRNLDQEVRCMEADVKAAFEYYQSHLRHRNYTDVERHRFQALVRRAEVSCDAFRIVKRSLAKAAAEVTSKVLAPVAFAGAFVVTHSIIPAAIALGAAHFAGRVVPKWLIRGRITSRGEVATDGVMAAFDSFTGGLVGKSSGLLLWRRVMRGAAKAVVGKAFNVDARNSRRANYLKEVRSASELATLLS